jgi:hypothetical protein
MSSDSLKKGASKDAEIQRQKKEKKCGVVHIFFAVFATLHEI